MQINGEAIVAAAPPDPAAVPAGRNIVILSDGTGQRGGVYFDEARTNVYKLYRAARCCPDSCVSPERQLAFYDAGLGTRPTGTGVNSLGRKIYNYVSQATGLGVTRNIIDCYAEVIQLWRPGDRIFLLGFSRGAYTVRCVATALCYSGIPTQEGGGALLSDCTKDRNPSGESHGLAASPALADGLSAPAFGEGGDFRCERLGLVGIGIEVIANPFRELGMSRVSGVLDGGEEFSVAPGTAAVFRRAAAGDVDQARIEYARLGIGELLDLDRVLPAVAEVIKVHQLLRADVFEDVAEPRLAGVEKVGGPIRIGIGRAPADVAGMEHVEVAVGPAHGCLDGQVQPVEPNVERDLDATQNGGLDVVEGDFDAGDGVGTHAATLRCALSAAQFHGKCWSSLWMV